MKWKCRDCHIGSTSQCGTLHLSPNVPSAKTLFLPHYCSCISIRFRQRWKSAALHMKWKCRDCHIGSAASVALSTYRLMCQVPNIVHIIMSFVFAPSFFVHFNQISAEMKVSGAPYEMEVPRLPYWLCSQCDTLHLSFNVPSAKHCSYSYEFCFCHVIFRALYLNFDLRECRVILSYWH